MNPNHHHHHHHHHHHPHSQFPNPPPSHFPISSSNPNPNFQPSPYDVATALSALTNLIHLTELTLSSDLVSDLVRNIDKDADDDFAQCPYNATHRMPAGSLFAHYLTCPNSLDLNHLLSSLRYPYTLDGSRSQLAERRDSDLEDELCFSVDGYGDFCVNYFYKDCPGVVGLVQERYGEKRVFTLPRVLYVECKDFAGSHELRELERSEFKLLASEFWLGRCEVESWNDYPGCCSLRVLKMISIVWAAKDMELEKWVIVNSPSYGVVIDKAMRDHIVLLFKLCLRAMAKEAYKLVKSLLDRKGNEDASESNSMDISFDCKFMNEVLGWFISQLAVLYGEGNGKYFGINMLKNCIIKTGLGSLLFPLKEKTREDCSSKDYLKNSRDCEIRVSGVDLGGEQDVELDMRGKVNDGILLSQVSAAVAALYERTVLERKIRGFRSPQPLPRHQIVAEHDYLTNKAREERQKRPNYRSIVEHDGLIWQHSHSQETNRTKTKEELLAEERDYKRRRMSYRGKKMKRSTTEVMRGIIEEYMEEIKQAGGIGCLVKGSEEARIFPREPAHSEYKNSSGFKSSSNGLSDKSRRQSDSPLDDRCESVQSFSSKDYEKQKSEAYGYVKHFENHRSSSSSNRHGEDHISISKGGSQQWSEDRTRRIVDHKEITKPRHDWMSFGSSSDRKSRSVVSSSDSRKNMVMYEEELESKRTGQKNINTNFENQSVSSDPFDDRYDPSNAHTMVKDDELMTSHD